MHLRKRDTCDKKMSVRGKQNFDGGKNNCKIAGRVANTFLNSGVFFRSKRHIGQKESEISIFFQKSSTVIYKHNCELFSLEKKSWYMGYLPPQNGNEKAPN